ncbi:MAG: hypothetical protein AAF530_02755 [Pseudomonadota bacterium]
MSERINSDDRGFSWPDSYRQLLPILREQWGVQGEIYLTRQLSGGKSGAMVYLADLNCRGFTGLAILKLDRAPDPAWQEKSEAERHILAYESNPEFAEKHLPRILHTAHDGEAIAILSTIAGRGLEFAVPWQMCDHEMQERAVKKLSHSLLEDWNHGAKLAGGLHAPQALLQGWLGYRLNPNQGRLWSDFRNLCGLSPEQPSFTCEGRWYPNPLAFAVTESAQVSTLRLRPLIGNTHGDLNGLNVMVRKDGIKTIEHFLIDLAFYEKDQFLFFDHGYFALSYLLGQRSNVSISRWLSMLDELCPFDHLRNTGNLHGDDIGLINLLKLLRQGVFDWVDQNQPHRLSYMESQFQLAQVAVGLNFASKKLDEQQRRYAVLYAAAILKDYLRLQNVDWPKTGPELLDGTDGNLTGGDHSQDQTQTADDKENLEATAQTPPNGEDPARDEKGSNAESADGNELPISELPRRGAKKWPVWATVAMFVTAGFVVLLNWGGILPSAPTEQISKDFIPTAETQPSQHFKGLRSIAVLPFANLNGDNDDTFSDGLTIEIIGVLAATGAFRVTGFTSVFQFKNRHEDVRQIGQTLDVEYVIEGSVRRVDDEVRIEANLIRTDSGFLVWSGKFHEKMNGMFVAQEKVATAIGEALSTPLDVDSAELEANRTEDPQAYQAFLRGIALLEQRGKALIGAVSALERAVDIEPEFAAAWAALSMAYNIAPTYLREVSGQPMRPEVFYRKSKSAAFKALELDPDLAMVQHALGNMYNRDRQWSAADKAYRKALELDPSNHRAMQDYGGLLHTVGLELDSLDYLNRAKELDPINDLYVFMAARVAWQETGSPAQMEIIEQIFRNSAPFRELAFRVILSHRAQGNKLLEAREKVKSCADCSEDFRRRALSLIDAVGVETVDQIFEQHKDDRFLSYQFLHEIGGADAVLDSFEYNGLRSYYRLQYFTVPWTLIREVGSLDRFQDTVRDMGLLDFWQTNGWPPMCQPETGTSFSCQ